MKLKFSKYTFTLLVVLTYSLICASQNEANKLSLHNDPNLNFENVLKGVRYAQILATPEQEANIKATRELDELYSGFKNYLIGMGFEKVGFTSDIRKKDYPSECEIVFVGLNWELLNNDLVNFTMWFQACTGESFEFVREKPLDVYSLNSKLINNVLVDLYRYKKMPYDPASRLKLKGEKTLFSEKSLKDYYKNNRIDPIEGIYESIDANSNHQKSTFGVKKTEYGYDLIYISGNTNYLDWSEGDIKAKLFLTATPTLFKSDWYVANKFITRDFFISFESAFMYVFDKENKYTYLKLYPNSGTITGQSSFVSSGTGFAISKEGYIVTNYHVIEGAKSLKVRGLNDDFNIAYEAQVATQDKNNDLAILKISDQRFTSLDVVPFSLFSDNSDVGNSVFVLGFPLRATMGDEVKLTNGIISSKSGYQGDITSYQISAPIQPGNSGGPLFDQKGNIIGVINAKLGGAENVSYAIKSSYLNNLIQQLPIKLILNSTLLRDKQLSDQVKIAKKFVYIIEVE